MSELRPTVFPAVHYRDPEAALRFLTAAFGAREKEVYRGEDGVIRHAELSFGAGLVMFGGRPSNASDDQPERRTGPTMSIYVVIEDVDAHCVAARSAGATIVREPEEMSYGSREYGALDCEGFGWSFGTYDPYAEAQ